MTERVWSDPFLSQAVELRCSATIGGERVTAALQVAQPVYDDPVARSAAEQAVREALVRKIVEKWTPVIRVRR